MKLSRWCFGLFIICFTLLSACNKDEDNYPSFDEPLTLEQNVDSFVETYVQGAFPGISIFVRSGSDILLSKSYGLANLTTQSPVTSDTPFYLASVSKQITAMTSMILVERGLLSYETSIQSYLTEAPDSWSNITIHQLLTHRSGLPDYLNDLEWYAPGLTNDKVFQDLIHYESLEFEPGSKHEYSNSGYVLLAIITSRISGKPFQEFVKDEIFTPLGMSRSTVYDESEPSIPDRAIGYQSYGRLSDYELLTMGDGGMYSTLNDLDKWERSFASNMLITEITKNRAFTSHHSDGYGYGWFIEKQEGAQRFFHEGGLNGYRTLVSRFPSKDFSVIMLSNGSHDWLGALHDEIVEHYL